MVDTAVQILQADKGSLWCWDEGRQNLVIQAACGFIHDTLGMENIPRGDGVVGWVAENGEPVTIEDANQDPRVTPHIIAAEGIRAFVQVPIKVRDDIFQKLDVPGRINDDVLTFFGFKKTPRRINRDSLSLLIL